MTEKLEEKPKEHLFRKYNSLAGKYWREKLQAVWNGRLLEEEKPSKENGR